LQEDGQYVMKYPLGMSLMYLPFFLLGHLAAFLWGFPMDGFAWPYQFSIAMGSIVYACIGLWIMRSILLRYFSDEAVAITLAILVLCTNYLNYVSIDGAMPHNYLFTVYAAIIWFSMRWHESHRFRDAAGLGLLVGLATIMRPTELISILIPVLWGISSKKDIQKRLGIILAHWPQVIVLSVCLIAVGSLQLMYWKIYSGDFFHYSYEDQGFDWLRPHLIDGIFSARKGWLMYTPVMIFALIGFRMLYQQYRQLFWSAFIYVILNIYIVFSWEIWWYGGGFGARALIPSYAMLMLPLAACISYMLTKPYLKIGGGILIFLCMDLNLSMTWQAHAPGHILHTESMTKAYYWKIFGNTKPNKADKKFLDVKHELGSTEGMQIIPLYRNNYESDTSIHVTSAHKFSGNKSIKIDEVYHRTPEFEFSLREIKQPSRKDWVRVSAQIFYTDVEWNEYEMGQLIVQFLHEGDSIPYRGTYVKIQRLCAPWQWHHLTFEMKFPRKVQPTDRIRMYATNEWGKYPIYLDEVEVDLIRP